MASGSIGPSGLTLERHVSPLRQPSPSRSISIVHPLRFHPRPQSSVLLASRRSSEPGRTGAELPPRSETEDRKMVPGDRAVRDRCKERSADEGAGTSRWSADRYQPAPAEPAQEVLARTRANNTASPSGRRHPQPVRSRLRRLRLRRLPRRPLPRRRRPGGERAVFGIGGIFVERGPRSCFWRHAEVHPSQCRAD